MAMTVLSRPPDLVSRLAPWATRAAPYCGSGLSATLDAFALTLPGEAHVAVYDGSVGEWMADPAPPAAPR